MDTPFIGSPIRWLDNDRPYVRLADIDVRLFAQRAKRPGGRAGNSASGLAEAETGDRGKAGAGRCSVHLQIHF